MGLEGKGPSAPSCNLTKAGLQKKVCWQRTETVKGELRAEAGVYGQRLSPPRMARFLLAHRCLLSA